VCSKKEKIYPKEFLVRIVERAVPKCKIVNGSNRLSYHSFNLVVGTARSNPYKIYGIKKQERIKVIKLLQKDNLIRVINKHNIELVKNKPF